jgi:SAM-dependent methyltransferase
MTSRRTETSRRVEGCRLVYYRKEPDAAFWNDHWQGHTTPESYASAERGSLGALERPVLRHLPRAGKILEAGCGPGHHVLALRQRGYDAEGVDWAAETVATARARYPTLPVMVGDVARLPAPSGHYAGYLSFGVVEHRREGPEAILREAHRVLRPGGIALVSVPFFHPGRRLKARLGAYAGAPGDRAFYQYAFTADDFAGLLRASGFAVVRLYAYDSYKGIVDEVPWMSRLLDRQVGRYHLGSLAQRALRVLPGVERRLGHMLLVVGRSRGV